MSISISYPISALDSHIGPRAYGPRANMGVSGRYRVRYGNRHTIISIYYILSSERLSFLTPRKVILSLQWREQCYRHCSGENNFRY